MLSKL
jgi:hypothetical protein